jgi:hypothetical protein
MISTTLNNASRRIPAGGFQRARDVDRATDVVPDLKEWSGLQTQTASTSKSEYP